VPALVSISMMINVRILFACFECFRRSAPLIRLALRTRPVRESTLSPNVASQISSSLLFSSTACQGEGWSERARGGCICVQRMG
jgi:hypothetical protein